VADNGEGEEGEVFKEEQVINDCFLYNSRIFLGGAVRQIMGSNFILTGVGGREGHPQHTHTHTHSSSHSQERQKAAADKGGREKESGLFLYCVTRHANSFISPRTERALGVIVECVCVCVCVCVYVCVGAPLWHNWYNWK